VAPGTGKGKWIGQRRIKRQGEKKYGKKTAKDNEKTWIIDKEGH